MAFALLILTVFVLIPALAVRYGVESRPGFGSRVDWRSLDS